MKHPGLIYWGLLGCALAAFGAWAASAWALPRYSAQYEQNCILCHMNPTGGGQRSAYAVQQLVPMEMSAHKYTPEEISRIDPQLGKNVSIGLDLRTMHHHADVKGPSYEDFLQMQADAYLSFQFDDRFMAYLDRSWSSTPEVYALGTILPFNGYVKVGRFTPSFGWRFDDHTLFVRQAPLYPSPGVNGFSGAPAPSTDVGMEVGVYPKRLALTASITNGSFGNIQDGDSQPAYTGQALYRWHLGPLGCGLGGSYWRNYETGGHRTAGGPYGYLKLGPLTWLGEGDWSRFRPGPATPAGLGSTTHLTTTHEVSLRLHRGLELLGHYDFHDPDTSVKSGMASRYGAGFQFMRTAYSSVIATVNVHHTGRHLSSTGESIPGRDYTQSEIQLHVFY